MISRSGTKSTAAATTAAECPPPAGSSFTTCLATTSAHFQAPREIPGVLEARLARKPYSISRARRWKSAAFKTDPDGYISFAYTYEGRGQRICHLQRRRCNCYRAQHCARAATATNGSAARDSLWAGPEKLSRCRLSSRPPGQALLLPSPASMRSPTLIAMARGGDRWSGSRPSRRHRRLARSWSGARLLGVGRSARPTGGRRAER